ncbi:MAG: NAD(P)H-quinone oxidoreductase [Pseudoxanthomonas sp.]
MRAITQDAPGGPETLRLGEADAPRCGAGEVRIAVRATAVNRADVLQRAGHYHPPPGASPILGLEAMGVVAELGAAVPPGLHVGQRVMALLTGGGYAQEVVVPAGQVMPVPAGLSDEEAAAIPEVFLTAYLNLFCLAGLRLPNSAPERDPQGEPRPVAPRPQSVLIHGGASGIGTAALQLCRAAGAAAYCTVGADQRKASCLDLGATAAWNYHSEDFVAAVHAATAQRGVDIVLDCIGAKYLERNLRALAPDGRLVCIGLLGGSRAEADLGLMLARRLQIIGSTLRPLPPARKAALVHEFTRDVLPLFAAGTLRPVVDRVLPLSDIAQAHRAMDEHHVGKIVLRVS